VSEHIGTRDLVQEYLANRVFPTLRKWGMPKLEEEKKEGELVRLPYQFKFKKHFKEPCQEWLGTIEVMCNEILGNYTKKEDQLMTAAFGSRPKRRLNRVMDALHFEYPDYGRLNKGAEGQKRKRVVNVVGRQAAKMVKEDEEKLKKRKLSPKPTAVAPKKRKAAAPKQKATDIEEETPASPSATDVAEILKVMTESLPIKLSPLAPHLTKLFQKKKEPTIAKKAAGPKKRRIITVIEAIEEIPRPASASKAPAVENTAATEAAPTEAATAEAEPIEDANLESTLSNIDKVLLNMAVEEAAAAAEETTTIVPEKEKEIVGTALEEENFNFQNLIGQELTKAEKEELREYAISCGYQPGALLFGGVDDERLGCL
jgi:DNA primase